MSILILVLHCLYVVGAVGLALYGFNALWLVWQSRQYDFSEPVATSAEDGLRNASIYELAGPPLHMEPAWSTAASDIRWAEETHLFDWPCITVQLPVYNEQYVVERLIDACAQLHYPAYKLQIQVLDDSTDHTVEIIDRCVRRWQQRGCNIEVVRRVGREGYKAGALRHALPHATGDYIAIFDADFVPPRDFLLSTMPHFLEDDGLGFIQTRWGHLNADYSPLTRSQALALDGHFLVEQAGRQAAGYAFGFNGSAGIWRRACVDDPAVGGWQIDTLCEDLDLSYRAQLVGWRPLFLNHIEAPAEIPPQLSAFKRQQARWARGSIQTLRKLAGRIGQSDWSLARKLQGFIHLGSYLLHPLLLLLLLLSLPLALLEIDPAWPLTYLSAASIGPPLLYAMAQRRLHPHDWAKRWSYIGVLTLLGFGLCLSNTLAVWQAWRGTAGQFLRTPKFRVQTHSDGWQNSVYRLPIGPVFLGELALFLYALSVAVIAAGQQRWWAALFALLYVGGFGLMISVELWQDRPTAGRADSSPPADAESSAAASYERGTAEQKHLGI